MPTILNRYRLPSIKLVVPRPLLNRAAEDLWLDRPFVAGCEVARSTPLCSRAPEERWQSHFEHKGRRPPKMGKGNFRGSRVDDRGREIVVESTLEKAAADIMLAMTSVDRVDPQVGRIFYSDADGKGKHSTLDFVARTKSGRSVAIAVKPQRRVEPSGLLGTVAAIKKQRPDFADDVRIWTERQVPRSAEHNAGLILRSRRLRDERTITLMTDLVAKTNGVFTLSVLMKAAAPLVASNMFTALVNMIDTGVLVAVTSGRITPSTKVRFSKAVS